MKVQAVQALRGKLAADQPVHGIWVTLESASVTEMAVALGLDYVVIDAEHGHLDWQDVVQHVRASVRSNTVALVRISELNCALIKRVLDIGADGIIIPWMETAEQVEQAVAFANSNGMTYRVDEPGIQRSRSKSYAENFRYDKVS